MSRRASERASEVCGPRASMRVCASNRVRGIVSPRAWTYWTCAPHVCACGRVDDHVCVYVLCVCVCVCVFCVCVCELGSQGRLERTRSDRPAMDGDGEREREGDRATALMMPHATVPTCRGPSSIACSPSKPLGGARNTI